MWDAASKNVKKAAELQVKYYNEQHRKVEFQNGILFY